MRTDAALVLSQGSTQQSEIRQAIEEAQAAAREAAQEAAQAAREAGRTAREAARAGQAADAIPPVPGQEGMIVINSDGRPDVTIRVDGQGIHVAQQGKPEVVIPIRDVVPRGAVQMTYALSAALIAIAFVGPLLRYFLRRHERRATSATISAAVQERLEALERNIDTVAVEVERVSEGQRFTNKLLEQRPLEHAQRSDR